MSAFVKALSGQQFLYAVSAANEKDPVCVCVCVSSNLLCALPSRPSHAVKCQMPHTVCTLLGTVSFFFFLRIAAHFTRD